MRVDEAGFAKLAKYMHDWTGVALAPEKVYLAEFRLAAIAGEIGAESLEELCNRLAKPDAAPLREKVVEAMTTHETLFFRDAALFGRFIMALTAPDAPARRLKRLRIWSAACSTGQEPYSVAIALLEALPDADLWDIRITALDIAQETLETAKSGHYGVLQVNRGLPTALLLKHFERDGMGWKVSDRVRRLVSFERGNLMTDTATGGPFDAVLCRNVMIYFDAPTCEAILRRLRSSLISNGLLFLGGSENLLGKERGFATLEDGTVGIYRAK